MRWGETVLSAQVASSSGWDDHYRASVYLSPDEETVEDWSCTCPAVVEYDGLCKHCAALALSFSRAPEKFMGYTPKRRVATSACITELMRRGEQFADDSDMEGSTTSSARSRTATACGRRASRWQAPRLPTS